MNNKAEYALRAVTDADWEFIYGVKKEAYRQYVETYFGGWYEERQRELFAAFMDASRGGMSIITHGGADVGFINGEETPRGFELGNICIVPGCRGRGIGTAVLEDILRKFADRSVTLRYFRCNPAGRLYERLGFVRVGETPVHYMMERFPAEAGE